VGWAAWIQEQLDGRLTPALLGGDPVRLTRARLAVAMALTTAIWGPVFAVVYLAAGLPRVAGIVVVGTAYLLLAPTLLRRTGSTELAGHHAASALAFVIVGAACLTGGIDSSAPPWLVACSFLAAAIGGWRPGLTWLITALVGISALAMGEGLGVPYGEVDPGLNRWLRTSSLLGLALLVFSLVGVFQVEHDAMRRRLDEQIRAVSAASRAKSIFLANMSHELRTPMNAILGYTELVQEELEEAGEEALHGDLEKAMTAARNLLALIDDLLDLSRIEVGALRVTLDPHALDRLCEDVATSLQPFAAASSVAIQSELSPAEVVCDPLRVTQIVTNLLHNAVKFSPGEPVRLRCGVAGEVAYVEVVDRGPGLTEDQLLRVFDEFQQAHPAVRSEHGGTGLGLTISRRLAQAMGGELEGRSTPGEGSTFRLELPLARS
jgi:signal transduction histidine kinase